MKAFRFFTISVSYHECLRVTILPLRTGHFSAGLATGFLVAVVRDYNVSRGCGPGELVQGASR